METSFMTYKTINLNFLLINSYEVQDYCLIEFLTVRKDITSHTQNSDIDSKFAYCPEVMEN